VAPSPRRFSPLLSTGISRVALPASAGHVMFFLIPFALYLIIVFFVPIAIVIGWSVMNDATHQFTLEYFHKFFSEPLFVGVLRNTVEVAFITTAVTFALGYPLAYYLSRQGTRKRLYLSTLLLLPFYTSILVKSFALTVILGHDGLINSVLQWFTGQSGLATLLYNRTGVIIGIVHDMLPFLVFPIVTNLVAQDRSLRVAAEIMGASKLRIFWTVTFPLSLPGVFAGLFLVVVRALGQFAIPQLLGGRQDLMMSNIISLHVLELLDWNMAAAMSMVLLGISIVLMIAMARTSTEDIAAGKGV
jgi:ABC-type spermidine/putrescine transport system permease subunit I